MRRRDLMLTLGGAAIGWPSALGAQQKAMSVIGFLGGYGEIQVYIHVIQGLRATGYVERQNLKIEYRWAWGRYDALPAFAAEFVSRKVDLIVTTGGNAAALAAKRTTSTIPIVSQISGDPIGAGLIAGFARPGGNLTGVSILSDELIPKRVELLSELVPQARTLVVLTNPSNPIAESIIRQAQIVAGAKRAQLHLLEINTQGEISAAFASLINLKPVAIVVTSDGIFEYQREQLVTLAGRHALPAIYPWRAERVSNELISYGANDATIYRRLGLYAGRILNGAKPADLPVEQPTQFELVINLNTARVLGLTVPQSLLARATEVIE